MKGDDSAISERSMKVNPIWRTMIKKLNLEEIKRLMQPVVHRDL
jgi:hypothetical protein